MGMIETISNMFRSKEATNPAKAEGPEEQAIVDSDSEQGSEQAAMKPTQRRNGTGRARGKGKGKGKRAYTRKQKLTAAVPAGKVVHATDATFKKLANVPGTPVLVDFWAEWCGPCKMIAPVLDEVARELGSDVRVIKVDVDNSPRTAGSFSIRNIPTLVIMRDGEVMDVLVGMQSKGKLVKALKKQLSRAA